jgi:hypothetical protein
MIRDMVYSPTIMLLNSQYLILSMVKPSADCFFLLPSCYVRYVLYDVLYQKDGAKEGGGFESVEEVNTQTVHTLSGHFGLAYYVLCQD